MAAISLFCGPHRRVMALSPRAIHGGSVDMRVLLRGRDLCVLISVQLCRVLFLDECPQCVYRVGIELWRPLMVTCVVKLVAVPIMKHVMVQGSAQRTLGTLGASRTAKPYPF